MALLPFVANAAIEIDGIYFDLTSGETNTASVVSKPGKYSGDVVIPASVTYNEVTYSVTSIGEYAFQSCSGLTSVTIPSSITSMGEGAFRYCGSLISVNISSVEAWCKISFSDNSASPLYFAHHLYLNGEEVKDLVIPNSVTSISSGAFWNCTGLTSVTIPSSVTSIGGSAFEGCSGLTKIVVEEGNTVYDSRDNSNAIIETQSNTLLYGCMNTIIPNGVTSIGTGAFDGCIGLTSVSIPSSVTSIGNSAFTSCTGLTSLTIPSSVTSYGSGAFRYCSGLTEIVVEEGNTIYDSRDNCNAIIVTKRNELITGCMTTVIPNGVISIGNSAFQGCSGLTSVTIPNSVTTIDNYAFQNCSLTSVTIPNSVTSIGNSAFYYCTGLTALTIGNSVTYIGEKVISGCSSLTCVICYAENIPETDVEVFADFNMANATLYVPTGSVEAYSSTEPWNGFGHIERMSDYDEIQLISTGKGTWCSEYDLDFTNVDGLKAYIASGYDNKTNTIWLTRVYSVPAGEGLVLKGEPNGHYLVPHADSESCYASFLVGNNGEAYQIGPTTDDYKNFVMKGGQFVSIDAGATATIAKNRAYLQIPLRVFTGTRSVNIGYEDGNGITSIERVSDTEPLKDGFYYNLQGQRIDNPTKGLYIKNGRKVILR